MNTPETVINLLRKYQQKSIVPDSRYSVSCVLKDDDENIYAGANIEFKDRTLGICAEGAAISQMISQKGYRPIKEIWLMGQSRETSKTAQDELLVPCGICLQRLAELSENDTKVHIVSPQGKTVAVFRFDDLLAYKNVFKDDFSLDKITLEEELCLTSVQTALKTLMARSFAPDEKKREAVILQTEKDNFAYGVYFSSCCYKADIPALNMAIYNFLLSTHASERIVHVYYAAENSALYVHPEFSDLLKNSVISEIKVENAK